MMNTIMIILSVFMIVLTIATVIFAFWSIRSEACTPYRKKLADFEKKDEKHLIALVYFWIGLQDFEEKNYEKSIEEYTKAIESKPDCAEAYNNRGNAYYDLKKYDDAIMDYNKAIELKPNFAEAYNNRGNIYKVLEEYNNAIADYRKANELSCYDKFGSFNVFSVKIDDNSFVLNVGLDSKRKKFSKYLKRYYKNYFFRFKDDQAIKAVDLALKEDDHLKNLEQNQKKFS